jgi:hypothetical protein
MQMNDRERDIELRRTYMELNITSFFNDENHFDYSHSQVEGGPSASRDTWNAAKERALEEPKLLTSDEAREEWRNELHSIGFDGDGEQITSDPVELEALLIQFISGDIREMQDLCGDSWEEYQIMSERGTVSGRMYRGGDGQIYYSLSV